MWTRFFSLFMFGVYMFRHQRDYYMNFSKLFKQQLITPVRQLKLSTHKCFYTRKKDS